MLPKDVAKTIKAALKARSGKSWPVTCGRGSSYGWITISVTPATYSSKKLAHLLGLACCPQQGINIPASDQYYQEYIDRAQGKTPTVMGSPYWD